MRGANSDLIQERLKDYPALTSARLLAECLAAGYLGGITQLRDFVATIRPQPEPQVAVRFETAPGVQAQFDFAEVRLRWGKRYALLIVLGYSRFLYVEFVPRQTALTVIRGLEHAFAVFRGVPHEVLFDQLKTVIVEDHRPGGGRLLENAEFARFAAHWGFRIRACRPYRAQTKGKIERPVGYMRSNQLYGRTFLDDADLAEQCTRWLAEVANARIHGTTSERPDLRFARDEQLVLKPLAERPYRSLVLAASPGAATAPSRCPVPAVVVERRPLGHYASLVAEDA